MPHNETIPVLRTLTLTQLMDELRQRGMPVSYNKVKKMIELGLMPFAHVISLERDEYLIWRKGFEEWATQHSVLEAPL